MQKKEITDVAALLKAMAHPIRLEILCRLQGGELSVGELQATVQTTNGNLSQHLTILRKQGILACRREANFIYNRISDPQVAALTASLQSLFCRDLI
jgi:ArsR family transcriptional regulator, virulence genes transcriptional regulator